MEMNSVLGLVHPMQIVSRVWLNNDYFLTTTATSIWIIENIVLNERTLDVLTIVSVTDIELEYEQRVC